MCGEQIVNRSPRKTTSKGAEGSIKRKLREAELMK